MNGDVDDYDPESQSFTLDIIDLPEPVNEPPEPSAQELVSFELPSPDPLAKEALQEEFSASIDRILLSVRTLDTSIHRAGTLSRSANLDTPSITDWDKDTWITLLSRLSSRGLHPPDSDPSPMVQLLRERLFEYVMTNFREHMDLITQWLTEEWYSDTLSSSQNYVKWSTRIYDNILPFIEVKDSKLFIRFLGDLPELTPQQIHKLRSLCLDPERQKLGFAALKYLLLLRPPTRKECIAVAGDLYENRRSCPGGRVTVDADMRNAARDILRRWEPSSVTD
jgi:symplekin